MLSAILLSVPSIVISFLLLLLAAVTGALPVGGFRRPPGRGSATSRCGRDTWCCRPSPWPCRWRRRWSGCRRTRFREALAQPAIHAARARGLSDNRLLWKHALRLSLSSTLSIYGLVVASLLSGSFVVEVVMSWPGLGALMYEALLARDLFLVAGCAAAVSLFLSIGVMASDVALVIVDPRREAGR